MMKKSLILLTALAAVFSLAGCQRETVASSDEGTKVSSGKSVNTQLVLSVSTGSAQTKQTSDAVQVSGGFQGLKEAMLLTYVESADGKIKVFDNVNDSKADNAPTELNYLFNGQSTRRVVSVKIPENTNTLVFYGRGVKTDEPDKYGKLGAYSVDQILGNSYFELGPRLTDVDGFNSAKSALAGMLTDVMNTSLDGAAFELDGISVAEADYKNKCQSWADYAKLITTKKSLVEPGMDWYIWEEKLANFYSKITGITYSTTSANIELRAGSGKAILGMVKEMWPEIYTISHTPATTKAEAVAKKLAIAINTKLEGNTDLNVAGYFTFEETTEAPVKPDWTTVKFKGANKDIYANFPTNFNLLEGVAYMIYDADNKKFVYPEVLNTIGMGGSSTDGFKATDFYYPAELVYFGNSPVQTSDVEYSAGDYPATASAWSNKNWSEGGWPGSHVTSTSRSVAMVKNIRYGVAMLETRVEFKGDCSKMDTNNPDLPGQKMNVTTDTNVSTSTFQLTGVIVGGQPKRVGWNFLPVAGEGFIYDKIDPVNIPFPTGTYNYTVVFDNYNATSAQQGTAQETVHVALEFLNNGDDFYGMNNWVRTGEHFYLIGELDPGDPKAEPSSTVKDITWPTDGTIIPPYNSDGTSTKQPRIFIQDYKTTVTFKIGQNSLKYAYLTVPDLRSTNMTLGLSVDIAWKQGLNYGEVVVGGN